MGRKRNPERELSMRRWLESGGKMTLDELAQAAGMPKSRISKWKSEDNWKEKLKEIPKRKGGQKGNQNAAGRTPAKDGNKNAVTHGIYRKKGLEALTEEKAERIRKTVQGSSLHRMKNELESLLRRKAYLEGLLKQYTDPAADGELYIDKVVHMVVPKSVEEMQEEKNRGTQIEQIKDTEGSISKEKLKTAMKTIIKSSAFDRAMKVEAELNRLHGRIIKQLDSMRSYEIEWQKLGLEGKRYDLAKQRLTGEIELEDEAEEIIDDFIDE